MTDRELMQQALEALDWAADCIEPRKPHNCDCPVCVASDALRERLAQHEALDQLIADSQSMGAYSLDQVKAVLRQDDPQFDERMQRARERLAQPEQEPVAWVTGWHDGHCVIRAANPSAILPIGIALYTTPPRREWIGLTLEEIFDCTAHITRIQKDDWVATDSDLAEFAHVIEAKLKEKNA